MATAAVLESGAGGRTHWDAVYASKGPEDLSWHQPEPALSLELIRAAAPDRTAGVIDVGGGTSLLVDRLLDAGYSALTVLDISPAALEQTRARLGGRAARVRWEVADVTLVRQLRTFDVWHDRAVFHFLTDAADRRSYLALAGGSLPAGGHLIVGTFAPDGPERCSGLPVRRYDVESLAREFARGFELMRSEQETHQTPWGAPQKFVYCVLRRL